MGFSRMFGELGKSRQVFCSIDVALDVVDFDVVNVDIDVVHVDVSGLTGPTCGQSHQLSDEASG